MRLFRDRGVHGWIEAKDMPEDGEIRYSLFLLYLHHFTGDTFIQRGKIVESSQADGVRWLDRDTKQKRKIKMSEILNTIEVKEDVDGVLATGDKALTLDDFIHKITEVKNHNCHRFDRLDVQLVAKSGAAVLVIQGARKETTEETKVRQEKEEVKKANLEEAEFKEFLRLRKKFDKRKE
jgi:nitrate reductase NapAB chaperone NapD